ncbi:hypothetical protein JCM8208_007058 [Rhodotorula glutinis]
MPPHLYGEREIPSKPSWANYLDEVRHVAKTRRAPPNWDSKFTSPVLKSLFDGMKAVDRREVLSRLGGSERELGPPRSPQSTRTESRTEKRLKQRRSRLFQQPDSAFPAPSYAEPPRAPSPPTAPAHAYGPPRHLGGSQFATSFEDVARAARERLQGPVDPGLHDLGGLANALDDDDDDDEEQMGGRAPPGYHPRAREGELRRHVLVRRAGGDE